MLRGGKVGAGKENGEIMTVEVILANRMKKVERIKAQRQYPRGRVIL